MPDFNQPYNDDPIPTGSISLDVALSTGGILAGNFIEISGSSGSGKTTLCLYIIANAQHVGYPCAFIDSDQTFVPELAIRCGINPDNLYFSPAFQAEQAMFTLETLVISGIFKIIVLDSIAGLVPQSELALRNGESSGRKEVKLLANTIRRLSAHLSLSGTTIIFISPDWAHEYPIYHQLADNLDRLALQLHAAQRLGLRTGSPIFQNGQQVGNHISVNILKNPVPPFYTQACFDIMYDQGLDNSSELFNLGKYLGLLDYHSPKGYFFRGRQLGKEKEEVISFFRNHLDLSEIVGIEIRQALLPRNISTAA